MASSSDGQNPVAASTNTATFSRNTLKYLQNSLNTAFRLILLVLLSCTTPLAEGVRTTNGAAGGAMTLSDPQESSIPVHHSNPDGSSPSVFSHAQNQHPFNPVSGRRSHYDEDGYWREVKAIIGGVLGFWGGVGSLGTLFLVIVLSQRYCCKKDDDKDDSDG